MRLEGLLVGGSSGSALSGALRWLKSAEGKCIAEKKGANVVVLLADGYVAVLASQHAQLLLTISLLHSIRNYMSKPWFLKMALEAEPSPLAKRISDILKESPSQVQTDSETLAEGIKTRTQPNVTNRPDAPDEVTRK